MREVAEDYALPKAAKLGGFFQRGNDLKESFAVRWSWIGFAVNWGTAVNVKVILKVYRGDVCESYFVDTDAYDADWRRHSRGTRDFFLMPQSSQFGDVRCVKFSYIVHLGERSIPSRFEYVFTDGWRLLEPEDQEWSLSGEHATPNAYRVYELDREQLQRDVDWHSRHFEDLHLIPKFTKGLLHHPYHPKRYMHDQIDRVIASKRQRPERLCTVKVSVDCIDDHDFIAHLIHAHRQGVLVQCIVDWRKMTLTHSGNYARLKRSGVELLGVFCTPRHHLVEVEPDMHTKFVIFNDEDCIIGSFNITFDRWWANWESGMTFRSQGVCRMLDNIFQSQRGGVIQRYGVDPCGRFNLLYTFGRQVMANGKLYRPQHAIIAEIHRARVSIEACLFLINELRGEHHDSVVDALIQAHRRGVAVDLLFNGHLARQGRIGEERPMADELLRPLLPAVQRLKDAGIAVGLVYGQADLPVPYSPLHAKYCVIDKRIVLEGSFNWYNTSVFSHDLLVVAADEATAKPYLYELAQIKRLFRVFY